jgi:hypothetical protein
MHMVANDGENAAAFDARRAAALLELVTDKLEKKHGLRRATVPPTAEVLQSEPSPRAERRAAARSEAEDQVLDPPESRNREKSRTARRKQCPG